MDTPQGEFDSSGAQRVAEALLAKLEPEFDDARKADALIAELAKEKE